MALPAEVELVQCNALRHDASLPEANRELFTFRVDFIARKADLDHNCALLDTEAKKRQDFEAMLAEARHRIEDNSFLLRVFHKMFRSDVTWALQDYLLLHFFAVRKRTLAIFSMSSGQVESQVETLSQSTSSIALYLEPGLFSSAALSTFLV